MHIFSRQMKHLFLMIAFVILFGCSINPPEYPGLYTSSHSKGFELLLIKKDSVFVHITIINETMSTDSGTWDYDQKSNTMDFRGWRDVAVVSGCKFCSENSKVNTLYPAGTTLRTGNSNNRDYDFKKN